MTYPEYGDLLSRAEASVRADGGFVDPVKLHKVRDLCRPADWKLAVLGHNRAPSLAEMHLLLIADAEGVDPPLPAAVTEQRTAQRAAGEAKQAADQARYEALRLEWHALAEALPVPVGAAYNYSGPLHLEAYQSGANHIIVCQALDAGRLHRAAGVALCTTLTSTRHQDFGPVDEIDERRPTCRTCIRIACRLTGLTAPTMIQYGKR